MPPPLLASVPVFNHALSPTLYLSNRNFPYCNLVLLPLVPSSPRRGWLHLFHTLLLRSWRQHQPWDFSSPGWTAPVLAASPHFSCALAPRHLGGPLLDLLQHPDAFQKARRSRGGFTSGDRREEMPPSACCPLVPIQPCTWLATFATSTLCWLCNIFCKSSSCT